MQQTITKQTVKQGTILIVSTNDIEAELLKHILKNYNTIFIESPQRVIELILQKKITPDLIFIEHENDEMNGIDFLKKINKFKLIPTIIISIFHNPDLKEQALLNGAYDFIVKPYRVSKIRLVVQEIFIKKRLIINVSNN